jgi:hypothetical protein
MAWNHLRIAATLIALALPVRNVHAQFFGYGGGSTVQGDILRGEGAFLIGAGSFVYRDAMATSINVDTAIRLNEYIYNVAKNENRENAQHRAERVARNRENYDKILKRIRENPDDNDLEKGDALNDVMKQLLDPQISPSSYRLSPVQLAGETVRGIPFFYGPEDATFSMRRLSAKGSWPVGLRGAKFGSERRAYERAFDDALDQQIEGKLSRDAIVRVEKTLEDLTGRLDQVIPPSRDKIYIESRDYLKRLTTAKELLKRRAIEQMLGEIDKYSGTSVYDLINFMQKYNLRFGIPDLGYERELYPKLYESMKEQLEIVRVPAK